MQKSRSLWTLVLPFAMVLGTATAWAQDEGAAEGGEAGVEGGEAAPAEGTEGTTDPATGDPAATGEATAEVGAEATDASATGTDGMVTMSPGVYTKATWPLELTRRPITQAKGMIEIKFDTMVNLSKSRVAKPIALSPNIYYGVSDKLAVGLTHETGLCVTGKDNGCPKVYNDVGIDAVFAFMTGGPLNLGAHGNVEFGSLDPMLMGLNVGVLGKYMAGKLAVTFDPKVYIGLNKRDAGNKEALDIPVNIAFQATPNLAPYLTTGISGPFSHFGDLYGVNVGVGALYAISNKLDVGAQFDFPRVVGGSSSGTADIRSMAVFANFRL